jgi:hypothetical protein
LCLAVILKVSPLVRTKMVAPLRLIVWPEVAGIDIDAIVAIEYEAGGVIQPE